MLFLNNNFLFHVKDFGFVRVAAESRANLSVPMFRLLLEGFHEQLSSQTMDYTFLKSNRMFCRRLRSVSHFLSN